MHRSSRPDGFLDELAAQRLRPNFWHPHAEVLVTPVQAPNANAYAERWIRTVRAECLDWLLIASRGHLEQVLRMYVEHYNRHRPHRALGLEPPGPSAGLTLVGEARRARVRRRDLLGGLHERIYVPYGCPRAKGVSPHPRQLPYPDHAHSPAVASTAARSDSTIWPRPVQAAGPDG
jgi:Integrase core domain